MSFAAPVSRGNFFYNGDLYVDVGNFNRHRRASVAELTQLLRPELNTSRNSTSMKDQVGHWYEAQLLHYGLPPSKAKATAKMRLLDCLNSSSLKVPTHIAQMEAELRKEFAANERKAKALHKKEAAATSPIQPASAKKRKQPEDSKNISGININVNLSVGNPIYQGFNASHTSSNSPEPTARKKQTAPSRRGNAKAVTSPALSRKQPVAKSPSNGPKKAYPTKQTARRGGARPSFLPARVSESSENSESPDQVMPRERSRYDDLDLQTPSLTKKPKKETKAKDESKMSRASKLNSATSKEGPRVHRELKPPTLGLINGVYDIICPELSAQWNTGPLILTLTLDSPSVWGTYDFDIFNGIMHLLERPWTVRDTCFFYWRGRENGEGEMNFGPNCTGEIQFIGNGEIEGSINLLGNFDFTGRRRPGPGNAVRAAADMQAEWEDYNEDAYEHERVNRWR